MTDCPDLYLMRHGETVWNAEGRLQGLMDSPLTERGRQQASRQAVLVAAVAAHRYSSPLGRAVQTAGIVFAGAACHQDARLAEIDIGRFAGQRLFELRDRFPDLFQGDPLAWYDHAPGGEGFTGLARRARSFLDGLRGPSLIVTHGITLRMLRLLALGLPLEALSDLPVVQGAVHVVRAGRHEVWR
ncbi:histidine phosphatase family protein [Paracoccus spongiarum]|uniref:Histidine phosphatase family protein n=1 Tax=Paracoccus spongiarum TaxID=3064387 RepID=A0ABT9JD49_9RHOB|nr:histidine phosphatase family protein [Paracoccus sp. 2205BS29-5]MDP5307748.1 histidine phosphatase family protein [Paracoccus sp. 2205BS29-5]